MAEEPGGLQSMGLHRVRHDWATKCARAHTHTQQLSVHTQEEPTWATKCTCMRVHTHTLRKSPPANTVDGRDLV